MNDAAISPDSPSLLKVHTQVDGNTVAKLTGNWTLRNLAMAPLLRHKLEKLAKDEAMKVPQSGR